VTLKVNTGSNAKQGVDQMEMMVVLGGLMLMMVTSLVLPRVSFQKISNKK
jgi:hypothetical protein